MPTCSKLNIVLANIILAIAKLSRSLQVNLFRFRGSIYECYLEKSCKSADGFC